MISKLSSCRNPPTSYVVKICDAARFIWPWLPKKGPRVYAKLRRNEGRRLPPPPRSSLSSPKWHPSSAHPLPSSSSPHSLCGQFLERTPNIQSCGSYTRIDAFYECTSLPSINFVTYSPSAGLTDKRQLRCR